MLLDSKNIAPYITASLLNSWADLAVSGQPKKLHNGLKLFIQLSCTSAIPAHGLIIISNHWIVMKIESLVKINYVCQEMVNVILTA